MNKVQIKPGTPRNRGLAESEEKKQSRQARNLRRKLRAKAGRAQRSPAKVQRTDNRAMPFRMKKVLDHLKGHESATIAEMARACFPGFRPAARANSTVRNQLRGLVKHGKVKQVARGRYEAVS